MDNHIANLCKIVISPQLTQAKQRMLAEQANGHQEENGKEDCQGKTEGNGFENHDGDAEGNGKDDTAASKKKKKKGKGKPSSWISCSQGNIEACLARSC